MCFLGFWMDKLKREGTKEGGRRGQAGSSWLHRGRWCCCGCRRVGGDQRGSFLLFAFISAESGVRTFGREHGNGIQGCK